MKQRFMAAAVQMTPVFLDREATTDRACHLIEQAATRGCDLVIFPESLIPMYPVRRFNQKMESRAAGTFGECLISESVEIPSETTRRLGQAAQNASAYVVIGVTERRTEPNGLRLYNSAILMDPRGSIIGVHRKFTLPFHEGQYHVPRCVTDASIYPTDLGVIGIGISFENLHPLYRYSLLEAGEEIHCALWITNPQDKHLMQVSARQHAAEGSVFVVAAGQFADQNSLPGKHGAMPDEDFVGGSVIVAPSGAVLHGPLHGEEGLVCAELNASSRAAALQSFDLLEREARHDQFRIKDDQQITAEEDISFTAPVELDREHTALVVIDMQYNDASPEHGFVRAREQWRPGSTSYYVNRLTQTTIPTIRSLLDYFRAKGMPIIYLMLAARSPKLQDMSPRVAQAVVGSVKRELGIDLTKAYSADSNESRIIEPLAPKANEIVVRKTSYGAFNSTELESILRERDIRSLVVVGVTTSSCVETTARDAADRGFGVIIVETGTCDWDPRSHAASIRAFRRLFGEVAESDTDIIERIESTPA